MRTAKTWSAPWSAWSWKGWFQARRFTQQLSEAAYGELKLPAKYYNADNWEELPEEVLTESLDLDIEDSYWDKQLEPAEEVFKQADLKFKEGREANSRGDGFNFVGVLFTFAMFFLGISLVFRPKVRWVLLGLGALVLVGASGFMLTLPSAGAGL